MSLVPNLFPAAMAFGLWGYLVGEVGIAIAVVGAMTLGIVVDDTVHFLSKYLRGRKELNKSPEDATHLRIYYGRICLNCHFLCINRRFYGLSKFWF